MQSIARYILALLFCLLTPLKVHAKDVVVGLSNPHLESGYISDIERNALFFNSLVFDPLFRVLDEEFTQPLLVESWESNQEGLLELRLKSGIFHHSGNPFQASDVQWTFELLLRRGAGGVFKGIERIEATGPLSLQVHTKLAPRIAFRRLAFLYPADSQHALMPQGQFSNLAVSGTGAFRLVDHQANVMTSLERNNKYWRPITGNIEGIKLIPIQSIAARYGALYTGDVDIIDNLDAESLLQLKNDPDLIALPIDSFIGVGLQLNHAHPLLAQLAIRQALNLSIDRQDLVNRLFGQFAQQTSQMSLPNSPRYNPDLDIEYDPRLAQELIQGIGGDQERPLTMLAPKGLFPFDEEIALKVHQSFERLNLDVELRFLDAATFLQQRHICQADILLTKVNNNNESSLELLAKDYATAQQQNRLGNCHYYPDIEIDQQLSEGLGAHNYAQVVESFRAIETKLAAEVAFISLLWARPIWAVRGQVEQHQKLGALPFPDLSSLQLLEAKRPLAN